MVRAICLVLAILSLSSLALMGAGPPSHPAAPEITLGRAAAPLYGPWKFAIGDSPTDPATGKWIWAEPAFDDSNWETMDLMPVPGVIDPWNGDPRWVPGWTGKGHPGYMGWAWYRLQVQVKARPGEQLAVDPPAGADDAYQLFANGDLIGCYGKFDSTGKLLTSYMDTPEPFPVPTASASAVGTSETVRTVTFAFRTFMGPTGMTNAIEGGGIYYAPLLGTAGSIAAQRKLDRYELIVTNAYQFVEGAAFLLLALLSMSVLLFDPSDRVYLWVAGVLTVSFLGDALTIVANFAHLLDSTVFFLVQSAILAPLVLGAWAMVWWVWFQMQRPAWVPKAIAVLTLGYIMIYAMSAPMSYSLLPHMVWSAFGALHVVVRMAFLFLLLLIIGLGIRLHRKDGWLVLAAALPMAIELFGTELEMVGVGSIVHPFGVVVFLNSLGSLFLLAVLGWLMLRRLLRSLKCQRQMALDVKQAQEVQQVILPEARTVLPGLVVESEYRPAREVGGDLFQIVPNETDGSLLIVAGDVTGKGLKAGMLVALLVGAIRSTVSFNSDPLVVLRELNNRLLGRSDAQATCLAIRIEADGGAALANAGHIAPYLNGEPMKMEGALPLGMIEGAEFSVMNFKLSEDDRLIIMSDGVVEATDANGNLLGFERVRELLGTVGSAAEVASAAQEFGQEDDISVISVSRTTVLNPAVA